MAGLTTSNTGTMFLNILDGVTETINQSSEFRQRITQDYEGKGTHIEHVLHTARNTAIRFMDEGTRFPSPQAQVYEKMQVGRKSVGGSIQLTDMVMAAASKAPEVAIDAVTSETEGLMDGILDFEAFFYSRDGTGTVATVQAALGAGTTLKVDDARGMWENGLYDVYDSTGTTLRGTVEVASINPTPDASGYMEVVLKSNVTGILQNDLVYWKDAKGLAYTGVDALIDDTVTGTFQGVTMSTAKRWTSVVLDASGVKRNLDPAMFRQLLAAVHQKSGKKLPISNLVCVSTPFQLGNFDEMYESALRLTPGDSKAGLKTSSIQTSYGAVELSPDHKWPYYKLGLIDFSQIVRWVIKKLGWRTEGGQIFKRSDQSPVWTATAIEFAELFVKQRNTSGKILDLNETIKTAF